MFGKGNGHSRPTPHKFTPPPKPAKYPFLTVKELLHIGAAALGLALAFSIFFFKHTANTGFTPLLVSVFIVVMPAVLIHEFAHKLTAIRFGASAEFRASWIGLLLTVGSALLLPVLFGAPGAVVSKGGMSKVNMVWTKAAGPISNLVLAIASLTLALLLHPAQFISSLLFYSFLFNSFLALFNLIPIWVLDGKAIFDYSKKSWAALIVPSFLMYFFATDIWRYIVQ